MTPRSTYTDRLAPLAALLERATPPSHFQDLAGRIFGPDEAAPDGTIISFTAALRHHPLAKDPAPELRIEATATTPWGTQGWSQTTLRMDHLRADLDPEGSLWRVRELLTTMALARIPT